MKRFGIWLIALTLCGAAAGRAQDQATEARLKELNGKLDTLIENQEALRQRVEALKTEVATLREQQNRPAPSYAGQEDLKRLEKFIEEVDRRRIEDNKQIHNDLLKLMKAVEAVPVAPQKKAGNATPSSGSKKNGAPPRDNPPSDGATGDSQRGFWYTVGQGDTLSAIMAACREKHIMVTQEQIVRANPRLKPDRLREGMKLFIPLPPPPPSQ